MGRGGADEILYGDGLTSPPVAQRRSLEASLRRWAESDREGFCREAASVLSHELRDEAPSDWARERVATRQGYSLQTEEPKLVTMADGPVLAVEWRLYKDEAIVRIQSRLYRFEGLCDRFWRRLGEDESLRTDVFGSIAVGVRPGV